MKGYLLSLKAADVVLNIAPSNLRQYYKLILWASTKAKLHLLATGVNYKIISNLVMNALTLKRLFNLVKVISGFFVVLFLKPVFNCRERICQIVCSNLLRNFATK